MYGNLDSDRVRRVSWYMERSCTEEWRDSEASSASRNRPGIIYVRERRADSIDVTEDWWVVMKEE